MLPRAEKPPWRCRIANMPEAKEDRRASLLQFQRSKIATAYHFLLKEGRGPVGLASLGYGTWSITRAGGRATEGLLAPHNKRRNCALLGQMLGVVHNTLKSWGVVKFAASDPPTCGSQLDETFDRMDETPDHGDALTCRQRSVVRRERPQTEEFQRPGPRIG